MSEPISDTARLTITAPSEREIVMTRFFHAPRPLVFEALTTPALLQRWLHGPDDWTMPVCEIDLRPGGALRYVWRGPDGTEMGMSGVFREITSPERIVHTELFDEDWTGGETQVTTVLTETGGGTMIRTSILYGSKEARDGALQTGMEAGMEASYDRLERVLG